MAPRLAGSWRIVEMDLWDRDAIDLVGPAFIDLGTDGTGTFRFIAVEGYLDSRPWSTPAREDSRRNRNRSR